MTNPYSGPPGRSSPPVDAAPPPSINPHARPGGAPHGRPGGPPPSSSPSNLPPPSSGGGNTSGIDPAAIPRPDPKNLVSVHSPLPGESKIPPTSLLRIISKDVGFTTCRFMRPTLQVVPDSADLLKTSKIPLGIIVQPFASNINNREEIPVADFGEKGPPRCDRCRAYMNPFMKFVENGRAYICNMCGKRNEVSRDYECPLDEYQNRRDKLHRPELSCGSYDFVASKDMISRPPQAPTYVFVINCSLDSINSGLLNTVIESVRGSLDELAVKVPTARIGIMTYDKSLYFFKYANNSKDLNVLVVSDIDDPFSPLPNESWILPLSTVRYHNNSLFCSNL
jgi:protein transport protein SEC24